MGKYYGDLILCIINSVIQSLYFIRNPCYNMFHVTLTTFKFNRNQLGTVSAYVM